MTEPPRPAPPRLTPAERAFKHSSLAGEIRAASEDVQRRREQAQDRLNAEGEAKARHLIAQARRCTRCGGGVIFPGRTMHYSCEDPLVGSICTCPPECSVRVHGDGPRDCNPGCVPCRIRRGEPLRSKK